MALTLQGASIGVDSQGVATALSNIQINLVDTLCKNLTTYLYELENTLDDAWKGASEEAFKKNLETDISTLKDQLSGLYEQLETEVKSIVSEFTKADAEMVKEGSMFK